MENVDRPGELQDTRPWRMAVWALRVGYLALVVVLVGLILLAVGSSPAVLAAGVIIWLVAAVSTATGFILALQQLSDPRPGFWSMRLTLLHDTVHLRTSGSPSA
jgi:hypothetical protein